MPNKKNDTFQCIKSKIYSKIDSESLFDQQKLVIQGLFGMTFV